MPSSLCDLIIVWFGLFGLGLEVLDLLCSVIALDMGLGMEKLHS